jgi:uncharacterized protein
MILNNIIKPTHLCNLSCRYCYNEDERSGVMDEVILDRLIKESFDCVRSSSGLFSKVDFIWHGGEPLILGLNFYKKAMMFQHAYGKGVDYRNSIQTNGTLMDEDWLEFFKHNNFSISVSLDGPREIHDQSRIYSSGRGSFDDVMKSVRLLKQSKLWFGVPLVISKLNKNRVEEIFDFFTKEKLNFHVIPLTKAGNAKEGYQDLGLEPDELADPWIKLYNKWFKLDKEQYVFCTDFVYKSANVLSGCSRDCISMKQCAESNISIDPQGNVYPCATFSAKKDFCYGNICCDSLSNLLSNELAYKLKNRKIPDGCHLCRWLPSCNGGCYSRAYNFYGDINTKDYYCPSFKKIYNHIYKTLREKS